MLLPSIHRRIAHAERVIRQARTGDVEEFQIPEYGLRGIEAVHVAQAHLISLRREAAELQRALFAVGPPPALGPPPLAQRARSHDRAPRRAATSSGRPVGRSSTASSSRGDPTDDPDEPEPPSRWRLPLHHPLAGPERVALGWMAARARILDREERAA
jgi:hypothetical protein